MIVSCLQLVDQLGLDGVMPTEAQLRKHKLSSLSDALHEMGGYAVVGEKLGLRTSKPKGYWTDFDNVVAELKDFMQGLGERLPTQAEIREAGRFDLISGMQVHGGMQVFAEHLDITMAKHKSRLSGYSMKRRLCDELLKFVEDRGLSGVMPNQQLLIVWGRDDLARGVERHGGRAQVAKYVGLEVKQADGELEMVGIEIKEIAAQMGKPEVMPAVRELLKRNRGDLAAQVEKRGWEMCASLLGLRVTDVIPSRTQVRKVVHEPPSEATASPEAALKIVSSASSKIVDAPLHRGVRGGGVAVYEDDRTHVSCLVVRGRRESLLNEEQLPQQMSDLRKRMRSKLNRRGSRPGSATSPV